MQATRKTENRRNNSTYYAIVDYIKDRTTKKIMPSQAELQILEVFKKLTESGWIVKLPEIRQIISFVGLSKKDIEEDE